MRTASDTLTLDGRGALVSNVSPHSGDPKAFTVFQDVITSGDGRIRKRDGKGALVGLSAGARISALHEYTRNAAGITQRFKFRAFGTTIQRYSGGVWSNETITDPDTGAAKIFTGAAWQFLNFNNRCYLVNGADEAFVFDGASWTEVGQSAPAAAPGVSISAVDPPHSSGTGVSCTKGNRNVTGLGGTTWIVGATWAGKKIKINGIYYEIATVVAANTLQLTEEFKQDTASGLAYEIYVGVGDWEIGHKYAVAFEHPGTGHVSNISPVAQISEQNQFGRTPRITITLSSATQGAYRNGFTKFRLFRTAKNGTVLVALNATIDNVNAAAGSVVFDENATTIRDTYLTKLRAPITSNEKPPTGIIALAVHQERLWALVRSSSRAYFTPPAWEIEFGVAAECWPAIQTRTLDEATGLFSVGAQTGDESLIMQTANGDFTVEGFDRESFNIFPMGTSEFAGWQGSGVRIGGTLAELYNDKHVFAFPGGTDLGEVIQNKLDLISDSALTRARLHYFASKSRRFLFVSVPSAPGSTDNDRTYVLNLQNGHWYDWGIAATAFATMHNDATGALELWVGDSSGAVYRWLTGVFDDAGTGFQPKLATSQIRFYGETAQDAAWIKLYVNDASGTWTVRLFNNEQTNPAATNGTVVTGTFQAAKHDEQSAQGRELVCSFPNGKMTKAHVQRFEIDFPSDTTERWIDKIVIGFNRAQQVGATK
jgi:hypothetical protein